MRTNDIPSYPCEIEIERVMIAETASCFGNVLVTVNGLRFSLGIMAGKTDEEDVWCAWPSRKSKSGKSYPLVFPVDEFFRKLVENEALAAFNKKRFADFYAAIGKFAPKE